MAYLSERFPLIIGRDPVGGPGFMTEIASTRSGFEQRNQCWSRSKLEYDFSHDIKSDTMFQVVGAHFRMARGRLHTFRVRDWSDFRCLRADGLLDPITATTFQLHKVYGSVVGFAEEVKITRIYPGSLQIWKDAVLQTLTTHYTVAEETGIVTFASAPGASVIEAACLFDVHCRYDIDKLQATLVQFNAEGESFHAWKSVPVVEVRE